MTRPVAHLHLARFSAICTSISRPSDKKDDATPPPNDFLIISPIISNDRGRNQRSPASFSGDSRSPGGRPAKNKQRAIRGKFKRDDRTRRRRFAFSVRYWKRFLPAVCCRKLLWGSKRGSDSRWMGDKWIFRPEFIFIHWRLEYLSIGGKEWTINRDALW